MRKTTGVVMFYVWFTAASALVDAVGLTDAMGVAGSATVGESFGEAVSALSDIQGGGISSESLLGLYTVATASAEAFLLALTAGPRVLINAGVPLEFVVFLHAPVGLLGGRFLIYTLSGRDL